MKILHVIHGYPPRFTGGAEVYTQALCHALADRHEVHVFTRSNDPSAAEFAHSRETDPWDARVSLDVVNTARSRGRYQNPEVDRLFAAVVARVRPDLVHVGHLAHLSTSVACAAAGRGIPVVLTLHDYWLMCPGGQFLQAFPAGAGAACGGQEDRKCAERCYADRFPTPDRDENVERWTWWVAERMRHFRRIASCADVFIAPSRYLLRRFRDEFGIPGHKLVLLECGIDTRPLAERRRVAGEPFTFGYLGRHVRSKGIHHLIQAFSHLKGDARLRIWGPPGEETHALRSLARTLPGDAGRRVEWRGEYRNPDVTREVLNHVDAVVVPSLWVENSPLVIREAQQARVPVITANAGGMAELVRHEVNGLLFRQGDPVSLSRQMQRFVDDPDEARRLGARGYLYSRTGDVPDIQDHARSMERIYDRVRTERVVGSP
jgi:glycosyltransferase involved in cell wall biosynthesis